MGQPRLYHQRFRFDLGKNIAATVYNLGLRVSSTGNKTGCVIGFNLIIHTGIHPAPPFIIIPKFNIVLHKLFSRKHRLSIDGTSVNMLPEQTAKLKPTIKKQKK